MIFEKQKVFQIAYPTRVSLPLNQNGIAQAKQYIQVVNGRGNLYRTIYNFWEEPRYDKAFIDKIYFDFDQDGNGTELKETRCLHHYLVENDIEHWLYFSGRGFHIFVLTESIAAWKLDNPTMAVKNVWNAITKEVKIHPDPATKDIPRIARIPNTMNMKSGLFCIPLSYEDIEKKTKEEIKELARYQRFENPHVKELAKIDLTAYDDDPDTFEPREPTKVNRPLEEKRLQERLPKCVQVALEHGDCGYQERFLIILALKDLNYSIENTKKILKKYLTEAKYNHCVCEENQLKYLYDRDFFFSSCNKIRNDGLCPDKNCTGPGIYLE
jgi:hypothetical protein